MPQKTLSRFTLSTIFVLLLIALSFQVSLATPGSITTLFGHDGRQFHGNMFNVTVINPLRITNFDMNLGWGNTTVTVYYRNGTYVGSEANSAAWTVLGWASVSGAGPNNRTSVPVSSPVLSPGTYGFYVTVTPTLNITDSTDMYYTSGSGTISNADIAIQTGIGVGGLFGDRTACQHYSRGYPNNPCIFPDRSWNGTIYYDTAVAPAITSAAPGNGTQGVAYSHTYTAAGNAPITFAVTTGALPPGLTLSSAGVISGTPTAVGTYTGQVTATNGITPNATQSFSITIASAAVAPSITSAAPGNGMQGVAYSHTYTANGTAPITFTLTAGALPPGLTLSSAGVVSGTPTTVGTYTGQVRASNDTAPNATQAFSITIASAAVPPSITSAAPGNGTQGVAYSHTYIATGTAPISFAVTSGALPPGLTLSSAGVVSGTPTTVGTYTGQVRASNGTAPNATQAFSITIASAAVAPTITSAAPGNGTVGVGYSHNYTATGTAPITFTLTAGALPPGLTLSSAGVISGTPTAVGTYTGQVRASNGTAPNATQAFSITIASAAVAPSITSAAPGNGTVGVGYSHNYTATGTAPISFALTAGSLPPGLTLSSAGVVSGTPTTAGTYIGQVTASNGTAPNAVQTFNITVAPAAVAPIITSAAPGNGTQGVAYSHTYTASGTAPINFALTVGSLPPGLTLSSAGVISGTPTTAGTYIGQVTASNGTAPNATQTFSITIIDPTTLESGTELTTLFGHDGRQFHGNMFNVTVINPLRITRFDMNLGWGNTTVTVYYRNGTYVGSETNSAAWTVLGSASVSGAGPNNRTSVPVSSPLLQPGTYGFYVTVTPTLNITDSTDMYYTSGSGTVSNADLMIQTGNGVGGLFGNVTACQHYSRGYPNNPCIFPDRSWNGTIYYERPVAPGITSAAPANGTVGVGYSHNYTATGSGTISYTLSAGTLPPGLTLSTAGVLSGTPTTAGVYSGTVTASNGTAPNATQAFNITITAAAVAPNITSAAPANGTVGVGYSHNYTATGSGTISYTVTAGTLPPGLTLSAEGVLSGTPTTAGVYSGTVTASNGTAPNATQAFNITITAAAVAPNITSAAPANGTVGVGYSHNYTATGSGTISYTVTAGTLPPGLTLSAAGVLSGTPTTAGVYSGTVTASNGTAPNATQAFNITITAAAVAPNITSAAPANGTVGVGYSHNYTATGTAPISYTVTAGTLPPGLTLSAAGVLSGTPTTAGVYSGTVTASNGTAPNATQAFNITVTAPSGSGAPSITSLPPSNSTQNSNYLHTYTATGSQPITFSVTSGGLPSGLTLSPQGVISGTPSVAGVYTGVVTASNGTAPNATQPFSIAVVNSNVPLGGPSLTTLFAHDDRQFTGNMFNVTVTNPLRITNFDMNVGWGTTIISVYYRNGTYIGSETNPAAWTLMGTAHVRGSGPNNRTRVPVSSPTLQPGVYGFYVTTTPNFDVMTATDLHYSVGNRTVSNADLMIQTGNGVGGLFGDPAACAHPSRAYFLNPCLFPERSWNGTIYYELANAGVMGSTSVTISTEAPGITSAAPANGTEGVAYSHSFSATGSGTISYTVSAGTLPPGLSLSVDGVLSGTPTTAGEYSGEVTASNGTAPDAVQPFTISIAAAAVAPSITSAAPADGTEGVAYSHSYSATGTGTISYTLSAGTLPPGLSLSAEGVLSGTPEAAGEYSGEVTASNGTATDAVQPFTISIAAAAVAPSITSAAPADGTEGVAYSHSYSATGTGTISYTVTAGTLPPGLTLSAEGVLSGTPEAAGEYSGEVTASNGSAPDAVQPFTITIAAPE